MSVLLVPWRMLQNCLESGKLIQKIIHKLYVKNKTLTLFNEMTSAFHVSLKNWARLRAFASIRGLKIIQSGLNW